MCVICTAALCTTATPESCFTMMDIQVRGFKLVIVTGTDSAYTKLSYINITTSVAFPSVRTAVF